MFYLLKGDCTYCVTLLLHNGILRETGGSLVAVKELELRYHNEYM